MRRDRTPHQHFDCLGCVLALLLMAAPALRSFEITASWSRPSLSFSFNPNFPDQSLAGTPAEQTQIIVCAASAWKTQTRAGFELRYLGNTNINKCDENDLVNAVFWSDEDGRGALAATALRFDVQTDIIRNFDIIFYSRTDGSPIKWSGPGEPPSGTFDIGGVATHELGHAVGLGHSSVPAATMFLSAGGRGLGLRTLHPDDREGIEFLYGRGDGSDPQVELTAIDPVMGPGGGGNEVVISGINFTYDSDTQISVDGMTVSPDRWTVEHCGLIRITSMPPHATGAVDITVSNTIGSKTLVDAYRYGSPAPRILSIEPDAGPLEGGISVTVTGEHFSQVAVITIDGKPLEDQLFVDPQTIVGTLPPGDRAGFVEVRLTQGADTFTLPDGFLYNGYRLEVATVAAPPATEGVAVDVLATSPDPLGAVSFGLLFDSTVVTLDDITVDGTLAREASFAKANVDNGRGVATFGLVMSLGEGGPEFPAGTDLSVARIIGDTAPTVPVGSHTTLELASGVGSPPIRLIFTPAGTADEFTPTTVSGAIAISEGAVFVRGDANDDGSVNIADAQTTLSFLFRSAPARRCQKAMDANDDGKVNISDPVWVLNFLFASGKSILPPYPESGIDPTPDDLPCNP